MHEVGFKSYALEDDGLRLKGLYFQAKIGLVKAAGKLAWRICVWHRLEDAQKTSWVVQGTQAQPFAVGSTSQGLRLEAPEIPALELRLEPFGFCWNGLEATELEAHRFHELGKSGVRSPAGWTAFHEVNDGLPVGAGLSLLLKETPQRRYFGLGERTGWLDKKGRTWTNWNTDDPNHLPDADPLYQAHPFVMGFEDGAAWGLYLDETWRTVFDLASVEAEQSIVHTDGPTFDLYLIPGPSPKEVLQAYTALVGRASLPPLWALGYHQCRYSYAHQDLALEIAKEYRQHGLPLDALWLDIDYMEGFKVFTFSPHRFPNPKALAASLEQLGIKLVTIVDPGVKKEAGYAVYEEGHQQGFFVQSHRDEELVGSVWPNPAVWPDFSRPEVREWWGGWQGFYLQNGVAGIWNDMNEPAAFTVEGHTLQPTNRTLPHTARQGDRFHAEVHNLYGLNMCQATQQGLQQLDPHRRPFILTRSGFAGIQRHAFVWSGDNHAYWEHLEGSLPMLLNLGLSGVPFVGADIGGFSADSSGELLARWTWLGVFYPFMRNHSGKTSRRQEPWSFGEPWLSHIRTALEWRYRLLPYLYTLTHQASQIGLPPMRAMVLEFPHEVETQAQHDQFMFGEALLVAPALRPQQRSRQVYLPQGHWTHLFSGQSYEGGRYLSTPTPYDQIPLFLRAGYALPLTAAHAHTSDAWWPHITWHLGLAWGQPSPIQGQLYQDEGQGHAPGTLGQLHGHYEGQTLRLSTQGMLGHHRLRLYQVPLPQSCNTPYSYNAQSGVLELELAPETWVQW